MSPVRDVSRDMSQIAESPEIIHISSQGKTDVHRAAKTHTTPLGENSLQELKVQNKVNIGKTLI
jgi:hypothetical protein